MIDSFFILYSDFILHFIFLLHFFFFRSLKGTVSALCFSIDGRFIASGGADKKVLIWDLAHGHLLAELTGHVMTVCSLAFSRDGTVLATASLDSSIQLWDFAKLTEESTFEDVNISHNPDVKRNIDSLRLARYPTKTTPVISLHFTRRNLLMAAGMFEGWWYVQPFIFKNCPINRFIYVLLTFPFYSHFSLYLITMLFTRLHNKYWKLNW